ncbi:MAG: 16S rRNA (guanine(966)-N(2))-methyltransferase RsmD [Nocardioidaceae bacterium]
MTRIIGGSAGGRRLRTPRGAGTRPTADRVREALFSSLESALGPLSGRSFLDLYAGTGAVALEALSRGAASATLVEQDHSTAALIRENARILGFAQVRVIESRVESAAQRAPGAGCYDVAFLDPPYDMAGVDLAALLTTLHERGWVDEHTEIVLERPKRGGEWRWPPGFTGVRSKRYGETMLWYGRLSPPAPEEA